MSIFPIRIPQFSDKFNDRFSLSADVVELMDEDGSLRLIHLGRNSVALDNYSTRLLHQVLDCGVKTTAINLSQQYGISEGQAEVDIRKFINSLVKRCLVITMSRTGSDKKFNTIRKHFSGSILAWALRRIAKMQNVKRQIWWTLVTARFAVKLSGWPPTVEAFKQAFIPLMQAKELSEQVRDIHDIDLIVRDVAASLPFIVECKERSLSCYAQCRLRGISAELIIGFSTCPFEGHAWVELSDGTVISDHAEHCRTWRPVVRYT